MQCKKAHPERLSVLADFVVDSEIVPSTFLDKWHHSKICLKPFLLRCRPSVGWFPNVFFELYIVSISLVCIFRSFGSWELYVFIFLIYCLYCLSHQSFQKKHDDNTLATTSVTNEGMDASLRKRSLISFFVGFQGSQIEKTSEVRLCQRWNLWLHAIDPFHCHTIGQEVAWPEFSRTNHYEVVVSNMFYFYPENLGKIPILTNISDGLKPPTRLYNYLWTPKPWKRKVLLNPQNIGCGFRWYIACLCIFLFKHILVFVANLENVWGLVVLQTWLRVRLSPCNCLRRQVSFIVFLNCKTPKNCQSEVLFFFSHMKSVEKIDIRCSVIFEVNLNFMDLQSYVGSSSLLIKFQQEVHSHNTIWLHLVCTISFTSSLWLSCTTQRLTDVRKSGELWWLRPDGKTQVTIECHGPTSFFDWANQRCARV